MTSGPSALAMTKGSAMRIKWRKIRSAGARGRRGGGEIRWQRQATCARLADVEPPPLPLGTSCGVLSARGLFRGRSEETES